MRLLDRYLLRELLVPLVVILSAFLLLWLVFDLVEVMDDFQENQLLLPDIVEYYIYKLPKVLSEGLVPVALLLTTMVALTQLSRHHELTAMRAAGIGMWRLMVPYLGVGVGFSLGLFWINEVAMPDANQRMDQVLERYQASGEKGDSRIVRNLSFFNERDGRKWTIGAFDPVRGTLTNVLVEWRQPDDRVIYLNAADAFWTGGEWTFQDFVSRVFDPANKEESPVTPRVASRVMEGFNETPEHIWSEFSISGLSSRAASKRAVLSLATLDRYFALHPDLGAERKAVLLTQFHARIAVPWTCLVVMLLAMPFAAPSGRRNAFAGFTAALGLTFAYFVIQRVGLVLGTGGHLPPWLAAWSPNLIFATLGIVLTSRVR